MVNKKYFLAVERTAVLNKITAQFIKFEQESKIEMQVDYHL
jgi:hypothetical protein